MGSSGQVRVGSGRILDPPGCCPRRCRLTSSPTLVRAPMTFPLLPFTPLPPPSPLPSSLCQSGQGRGATVDVFVAALYQAALSAE